MPDLIRHPVPTWIPAFAGMTILRYLIAGVITSFGYSPYSGKQEREIHCLEMSK